MVSRAFRVSLVLAAGLLSLPLPTVAHNYTEIDVQDEDCVLCTSAYGHLVTEWREYYWAQDGSGPGHGHKFDGYRDFVDIDPCGSCAVTLLDTQ